MLQAALDIVDCSVFAPPRIAAGERFKVQAHLHLAEQVAKVRRAAAEIDRRANLQGAKSLLQALARGVEVELYLACPGPDRRGALAEGEMGGGRRRMSSSTSRHPRVSRPTPSTRPFI